MALSSLAIVLLALTVFMLVAASLPGEIQAMLIKLVPLTTDAIKLFSAILISGAALGFTLWLKRKRRRKSLQVDRSRSSNDRQERKKDVSVESRQDFRRRVQPFK